MSESAERKKAKRLAREKKNEEMLQADNDKNRMPSKYARKRKQK